MTATETTPKAAPAAPTPRPAPCRCGCGQPTVRPEARYVAGHDARHAAAAARNPKADLGALFKDAPRLLAKAQGVRDTERRRAAEKTARKAAQAKAKAAYDAELAKALKVG